MTLVVPKWLVQCLAIGAGGFFGAVARFIVALGCARVFGTAFPVGTFLINISGSFFLGWFLTAMGGRLTLSDTTRLAVATGFVGAYTTFSTLMYESNSLLESGAGIKAAVNLLGSLVIGMLAVKAGIVLAGG